ncbi:unnamed protein product [Auanema sp. JU1783]|nr:unnamed protein product [Auanema sp. JU1783]
MGCVQTKSTTTTTTPSSFSTPTTIRGVIFDYSEVLWLHSRNTHLYRLIEKDMGLDEGSIMETLSSDIFYNVIPPDCTDNFLTGSFTAVELDQLFTNAYNKKNNTDLSFFPLYSHQKYDNEVVYEEIALNACNRLRENGVYTILLMNTFHVDYSRQGRKIKALNPYFDFVIESCVEGFRKPDPQIFKIVMKKTGLRPKELVMLDDEHTNCETAASLGIHTIQVNNTMDAIEDLEQLVGLELL